MSTDIDQLVTYLKRRIEFNEKGLIKVGKNTSWGNYYEGRVDAFRTVLEYLGVDTDV